MKISWYSTWLSTIIFSVITLLKLLPKQEMPQHAGYINIRGVFVGSNVHGEVGASFRIEGSRDH